VILWCVIVVIKFASLIVVGRVEINQRVFRPFRQAEFQESQSIAIRPDLISGRDSELFCSDSGQTKA
jgi:hypothetical protein